MLASIQAGLNPLLSEVRIIPLSSGELLVFWAQLAALLLAARACGALARRLRQPAVVGHLVAGLLLGPSVFGHVWPGGFDWFLPAQAPVQSGVLAGMINFSLAILLIVIGAETDIPLIRRLGRPATTVSIGSLIVPMGAGYAAATMLPEEIAGPGKHPALFAVFIALAVTISSLPIIAKIVTDMGLTRRDFGQLAFAVGTVNDTFGFLALAVAAALVGEGSSNPLWITMVGLAAFLVVVVAFGQRGVDATLRKLRSRDPQAEAPFAWGSLGGVVIIALLMSVLTQVIGVEGSLGAFLAGVLVGGSRFAQEGTFRRLEGMSDAVFAPLYFGAAGLRVDAGVLTSMPVLVSFVILVVVAFAAKFAGVYAGSTLAGQPRRERLALSIGLNGRGALQVIVATTALAVGVFDQTSFTVVILMSIVTSAVTPILLRRVMHGWEGTPQERERLEREEEMKRNVVIKGGRILLPSRGTANSMAAAFLLDLVWPKQDPVTLLIVGPGEVRPTALQTVADLFHGREVEQRRVESTDVLDELLAEARLGYGIIGFGVTDSDEGLLGPLVDELLRHTSLPLVIVRKAKGLKFLGPMAFHDILIPVSGDEPARAAKEVGFSLAGALDAETQVMHVVTRSAGDGNGTAQERAREVIRQARSMAGDYEVAASARVSEGASPGDEIVEEATRRGSDVIVLGANIRLVDGRPFLGHTVEHVLEEAAQTVVVVALPHPRAQGKAR
jgi:Kef-type K+ transport system membrane component KefB